MSTAIPLSILDLSPFGTGQSPAEALRASIDLARSAESWGYNRYWLAEHHLNPGIAGAAPHVLAALIAQATTRIRVGTAATIIGNTTALQAAESLGLLAALYPGRIDLGLGRSGSTSAPASAPLRRSADTYKDGLLLPASPTIAFGADRFVAQARLLGRTKQDADRFVHDVDDILDFVAGTYEAPEQVPVHATPAEGSDLEVWIHGSTAGPSSAIAGERGLPFGANYHVAPSFVVDAVQAYRDAFVPGVRDSPYVIVSVDVLVADSDDEARTAAAGYDLWVHSIRAGDGAIVYPTPEEAATAPLPASERHVVDDRLRTRFVGTPAHVVEQLNTLQRATGADELLITTITHDPGQRERSFRLLSEEWAVAGALAAPQPRPTQREGVPAW